ncbi:lytic polysaccharide monooxygenase [Pseudomonas sp. 3A(2025)]
MRNRDLKLLIKDTLDQIFAYIEAGQPRHGRVTSPKSRSVILFERGEIDLGQSNEVEGGKGFPGTEGDYKDPDAPDDVLGKAPPADGLIASGGHTDERILLNRPGDIWPKHPVKSSSTLTIEWNYSMPHKTRRWTYWLTREGWDDNEQLVRAHLEDAPIHTVLNTYQPYWGADAEKELMVRNPTIHDIPLPERTGHHVLLAIWNIADTAAAFYQVIDLDFTDTP